MSKKKKIQYKKKGKVIKNLNSQILRIFEENKQKIYTYKQICAKLFVNDTDGKTQILKKLKELAAKNQLIESDHKFQYNTNRKIHLGKIDITSNGNGYFICDDFPDDIFIPNINLNKALQDDVIKAYVYKKFGKNKLEASVVEVVERTKNEFVGVLQLNSNFGFVIPDSNQMYADIFISKSKLNDAENGDKVVAKITDWPENSKNPFGKITKVLGKPGDQETEIHSILLEYGLPFEFPNEVEKDASKINIEISKEEILKRKDFRDVLTFTIDPITAKDFDDALSFKKLENGNFEIGIHIADVSHYVQPNTILDDEAYIRATSVYLVDRVVPMLPEILSNGVCSLRPKEEKLTFSAVFELDEKANIKRQWFGRTVIYSDYRFAYEEVQELIEQNEIKKQETRNKSQDKREEIFSQAQFDNNDVIENEVKQSKSTNEQRTTNNYINQIPKHISLSGEAYTVDHDTVEAILNIDKLAKILREKRMKAGAISFDRVEVRFNLDEQANPTSVFFKESKDANKLIEEFMLLANKKVAEFVGLNKNKPSNKTFVYRIHDEPDSEKLASLQSIVKKFGYQLNTQTKDSTSKSINKLLKDVHGKAESNMIETLAIRSMSKAQYSTQNIGHYGLAFDYYSHFTSPIRRYPDVMTHRLLQHYLDGGQNENAEKYEVKCKHSSKREELAAKAERDSIKYMQVKFMQNHMDQVFEGVISGVTEWGIFVEIKENKCEGLVRIKDIKSDYFIFEEKDFAIVGQSTKQAYTLGDTVFVKVKKTDLERKQLDFFLIEDY